MRKFLIVLIIALLLPVSMAIRAETLQESPIQLVLMGSAWNDDNLIRGFDAGFKFGVQTSFDAAKGLWLRATYAEWNLTDIDKATLSEEEPDPAANARSVGLTGLLDWAIGKKWKFYVPLGAEIYFDGPLTGTDLFVGVGASRRVWTFDKTPGVSIPAHFDLFADLTFADGSGQFSGNYIQLNLGFKIGKPVKTQQ
ncbi:hypothetical protein KAR91_19205 [Candidatus Pacearchaeota archaeon]|nr:hypothetical protein [Candidatus Pacearchaeota archaeon]